MVQAVPVSLSYGFQASTRGKASNLLSTVLGLTLIGWGAFVFAWLTSILFQFFIPLVFLIVLGISAAFVYMGVTILLRGDRFIVAVGVAFVIGWAQILVSAFDLLFRPESFVWWTLPVWLFLVAAATPLLRMHARRPARGLAKA